MSHLHVPDGVLPPIVWICGLVLTLLLLALTASRRHAQLVDTRQIAFQSSLGGIMLAVMALPVPITAFDYCMTLAGPVGVLLLPGAAFQLSFVVTLILALLGQGGFTVVGLNALVLGLGCVLARPIYLACVSRLGAGRAMAVATALSQFASTACWALLLLLSVQLTPDVAGEHEIAHSLIVAWHRAGAAVVVPMLLLAVGLEAMLGYGLARFLERVRPDLLPRPGAAEPLRPGAHPSHP